MNSTRWRWLARSESFHIISALHWAMVCQAGSLRPARQFLTRTRDSDFGQTAVNTCEELKSAASLPLVLEDQLVGVLTIYSDQINAYSEQHVKALSLLAPRLSVRSIQSRVVRHRTRYTPLGQRYGAAEQPVSQGVHRITSWPARWSDRIASVAEDWWRRGSSE